MVRSSSISFLQHATLATEPRKHLGPLLLGLGDQRVGLGDQRVMLGLAGGHELVVLGLTGREQLFLPRRGLTKPGRGVTALR